MDAFACEVHTGKVPDHVLLSQPSLPSMEVWYPARAIATKYRGELQILALERVAARDSKRHMQPGLA